MVSIKRSAAACGLVLALGACVLPGGLLGKFSLSNAHIDAQYNCPHPATELPYDLHGSVDASNTTASTVTIKSMSEANQVVDTVGRWQGPKGQHGAGPMKSFSPTSVASGATPTIHFVIQFYCTNSGPTVTTYGDFSLKFTMVTSAGTYTIDSANHHRLGFPVS